MAKNKINIRFYNPETDFEAVIGLLKENDMDTNYQPHSFGSKAIVAENANGIAGFMCVIAGSSSIVYIELFVTAKKYHYKPASKHPAPPLLSVMMGLLKKSGYKNYEANIELKDRKVFKMATQKLGARDAGKRHLICGSISEFLNKIQKV